MSFHDDGDDFYDIEGADCCLHGVPFDEECEECDDNDCEAERC